MSDLLLLCHCPWFLRTPSNGKKISKEDFVSCCEDSDRAVIVKRLKLFHSNATDPDIKVKSKGTVDDASQPLPFVARRAVTSASDLHRAWKFECFELKMDRWRRRQMEMNLSNCDISTATRAGKEK